VKARKCHEEKSPAFVVSVQQQFKFALAIFKHGETDAIG
jgi:hypothetical protein